MNRIINKSKNIFVSIFSFINNTREKALLRRFGLHGLSKTIRWIVLIMFIFSVVIFIFHNFEWQQRKQIGVVNITGIVNEFVKSQAQGELLQNEIKQNVQVFGKKLEKIIHKLSIDKKVILMPSEAVIVGAKDYTEEVQRRLFAVVPNTPQKSLIQKQFVSEKNKGG